jgi:hypothetical protein
MCAKMVKNFIQKEKHRGNCEILLTQKYQNKIKSNLDDCIRSIKDE